MKSRRQRDYHAEYLRRIAKGSKTGKTRQQSRGHGKGETKEIRNRGRQKAIVDAAARALRMWPKFDANEAHLDRLSIKSLKELTALIDITVASDNMMLVLVHSDATVFDFLARYNAEEERNPLWYHS